MASLVGGFPETLAVDVNDCETTTLIYLNCVWGYWDDRASSSTFCPHPGRVIRDLFRLLNAVFCIVQKH